MASMFIDADRPALELGARLADQAAAGNTAVLPELRHLRAELGLSPLARQRLRWQLDESTERVTGPPRRPRRDLRAVS
jgi:hypothetical protein